MQKKDWKIDACAVLLVLPRPRYCQGLALLPVRSPSLHTMQERSIVGKMVYNWDGKRDTCYNMYITENKGLEEIQSFYREQGFNPR